MVASDNRSTLQALQDVISATDSKASAFLQIQNLDDSVFGQQRVSTRSDPQLCRLGAHVQGDAQSFREAAQAIGEHQDLAADADALSPRPHHKRIVDRDTSQDLHSRFSQLLRFLHEPWHMLGWACGSESSRNCKQHYFLPLGKLRDFDDLNVAFLVEVRELRFRKLVAYSDGGDTRSRIARHGTNRSCSSSRKHRWLLVQSQSFIANERTGGAQTTGAPWGCCSSMRTTTTTTRMCLELWRHSNNGDCTGVVVSCSGSSRQDPRRTHHRGLENLPRDRHLLHDGGRKAMCLHTYSLRALLNNNDCRSRNCNTNNNNNDWTKQKQHTLFKSATNGSEKQ